MTNTSLPKSFEDLVVWCADWALPGEQERFIKRINTPVDSIRKFYDAILPRMDAVLGHLKEFPALGLPQAEENLMRLALSYVEVSRIFEVWNQHDVRADFLDPNRLTCIGYEGVKRIASSRTTSQRRAIA
jgi:hypothetical protein